MCLKRDKLDIWEHATIHVDGSIGSCCFQKNPIAYITDEPSKIINRLSFFYSIIEHNLPKDKCESCCDSKLLREIENDESH
jgi:hypothetical protein